MDHLASSLGLEGPRRRGPGSALLDAVLRAASDLVYVVDLAAPPDAWLAPALPALLGWSPARLEQRGGEDLLDLVHPDDRAGLSADDDLVRGAADDDVVVETRVRLLHAQGGHRWVLRRVTPLRRSSRRGPAEAVVSARDITEAVELEHRLTQAALHDPLTGLPNRDLLVDRLGSALRRHARGGQVVPVLFCDLDGFKRVNDTAGHAAGDAVLVTAAQRLVEALRPQDTVARVGGDEFVVVLEAGPQAADAVRPGRPGGTPGPGAGEDASREADTLVVVERLVASLRDPITVVRGDVVTRHAVSVSVGVVFAAPGSTAEVVLQQADSAMYRAKGAGKDRYAVFDTRDGAEAVERRHVERTLEAALGRGIGPAPVRPGAVRPGDGDRGPEQPAGLWVAYQPVYDLAGMRLVGVEALARLTDSYGLALPPAEFIPVAERSGTIAPLGRAVLTAACRDLAAWHAQFPAWQHLGLAVNLSARQAGLVDLVDLVETALRGSGLAPSLLTLELTEGVLLDASRATIAALDTLTSQGVTLAIDDFGTGYASMSYLAQLPVSSVKVDRSFTAGLPDDPTCAIIVRSIARLAADLGLSCVVEGIETAAQRDALPAGVLGQGFLLGRPVSAAQVAALLATVAPGPAYAAPAGAPARARVAVGWAYADALPARPPHPSGHFRTGLALDREAAADVREGAADHRDQLADRRDVLADRREHADAQQDLDLEALLAGATQRDGRAVSRDLRAGHRDDDAGHRDDDAGPDELADRALTSGDRVHARMDRLQAARDRDSTAEDLRGLLLRRSTLLVEQRTGSQDRDLAAAARAAATTVRATASSADETAAGAEPLAEAVSDG